VRALRDDARWADRARIWPFETGLHPPEDAPVVFAEVWPSWWQAQCDLGPPKDKAQVRTVAKILATHDHAGDLASWFAPPIDLSEARQIIDEEAWTLGVIAPRQRAIPRKRR